MRLRPGPARERVGTAARRALLLAGLVVAGASCRRAEPQGSLGTIVVPATGAPAHTSPGPAASPALARGGASPAAPSPGVPNGAEALALHPPAPVGGDFDAAWARLATGHAPFTLEPGVSGEALMDRVRRLPRGKIALEPAPSPDAASAPEHDSPSPAEVAAVVRRNLGAVRACWLRLGHGGSAAPGKAIVTLTVDKDGGATDVEVAAPAFEKTDLASCVASQARRWEFPKSRKGGLTVSYPFVFVGG